MVSKYNFSKFQSKSHCTAGVDPRSPPETRADSLVSDEGRARKNALQPPGHVPPTRRPLPSSRSHPTHKIFPYRNSRSGTVKRFYN